MVGSSRDSLLTVSLAKLIESVQKRALRVILPALSYENALLSTGLETLADRRHIACQKFVNKMKLSDYCQHNNPLADILKCNFIEEHTEYSYNLRHDRPPRVWTNTERFVTVKYFNLR